MSCKWHKSLGLTAKCNAIFFMLELEMMCTSVIPIWTHPCSFIEVIERGLRSHKSLLLAVDLTQFVYHAIFIIYLYANNMCIQFSRLMSFSFRFNRQRARFSQVSTNFYPRLLSPKRKGLLNRHIFTSSPLNKVYIMSFLYFPILLHSQMFMQ